MKVKIGTVKVERQKEGDFIIMIPKKAAKGLDLSEDEALDVYVDFNAGELTYRARRAKPVSNSHFKLNPRIPIRARKL